MSKIKFHLHENLQVYYEDDRRTEDIVQKLRDKLTKTDELIFVRKSKSVIAIPPRSIIAVSIEDD